MDSLHICMSCRYHAEQKTRQGKRGGQILFETLNLRVKESNLNLEVKAAECLSACRSYCTLAFTSPHKLSMVFGRLDVATSLEETAKAILEYAAAYCQKPDGMILRADRPPILQDKLLARVPPATTLSKPLN